MGHRLALRVFMSLAATAGVAIHATGMENARRGPRPAGRAQETAKPPDILITLERTACFGACPSYTVTIDGSGNVVYEGRQFVRVTGRQTARIDPADVAGLVREFDRIGFFELKDEYTALVTDNPTRYIGIRAAGRSKKIRDYYDAPKALRALEDRVDEVAGTRRWVYIDPQGVRELTADGHRLPNDEARTQLSLAARRGDVEVVRALLVAGTDPNAERPDFAQRPLFMASSAAVIDLLIESGADVNLVVRSGQTPLIWHAQWGEPASVERLIRAGALVNAVDDDGRTALIGAAISGLPATLEILLKAGADPAHTDSSGHTALYYAEARLREDEALSKEAQPYREPRLEDRKRAVALLRAAGDKR